MEVIRSHRRVGTEVLALRARELGIGAEVFGKAPRSPRRVRPDPVRRRSARYGAMNYERCQAIGATVVFLECDGLLAPSARWSCDTLALFVDNHAPDNRLETLAIEAVDWLKWARANNLPASDDPDRCAQG